MYHDIDSLMVINIKNIRVCGDPIFLRLRYGTTYFITVP